MTFNDNWPHLPKCQKIDGSSCLFSKTLNSQLLRRSKLSRRWLTSLRFRFAHYLAASEARKAKEKRRPRGEEKRKNLGLQESFLAARCARFASPASAPIHPFTQDKRRKAFEEDFRGGAMPPPPFLLSPKECNFGIPNRQILDSGKMHHLLAVIDSSFSPIISRLW